MVITTTVPNVNIDVRRGVQPVIPGAIDTLMLFGTAQWGPATVETFSNFTDLLNTYKEDASGLTIIKAAELAYANGANTVKVVRMATGDVKATLDLMDGAATPALCITLDADYTGAYGNNIQVTITANAINPASVDVKITDGVLVEIFNNDGNGHSANTAIVDAINATDGTGSVLVDATLVSATPIVAITAATNLTGGDSGSIVGLTEIDLALTLTRLEWYNMLIVPGFSTNAIHSTIVAYLESRSATEDRDSIFISGVEQNEDIDTIKLRSTNSSRYILVTPGINITDRLSTTGAEVVRDPTYTAAAVAGKIMSLADVSTSPTNKPLQRILNCEVDTATNDEKYNKAEEDILIRNGVVVVNDKRNAMRVIRGITRATDRATDQYFEINIRRIVDFIVEGCRSAFSPFLGDKNIQRKRNAIKSTIDNFLDQQVRDEVIIEYTSEVKLGITPDRVDITILVRPVYSINFIEVTLELTTSSE